MTTPRRSDNPQGERPEMPDQRDCLECRDGVPGQPRCRYCLERLVLQVDWDRRKAERERDEARAEYSDTLSRCLLAQGKLKQAYAEVDRLREQERRLRATLAIIERRSEEETIKELARIALERP